MTTHYGQQNLGFAAAHRNQADRAAQRHAVTRLAIVRILDRGDTYTKAQLRDRIDADGLQVRGRNGSSEPVSDGLLAASLRALVADGRLTRTGRLYQRATS